MKDYRTKEMKYLLVAYSLLFLLWCTPIFEQIPETIKSDYKIIISISEGVAISGVLSLIVFLGDSLISSSLKDKLVGLFFIPRAGQTIFTRISNKEVNDDRFLSYDAISLYSTIIENMPSLKKEKLHYENTNWYKIYSQHKEDAAIMQTQKDFLLCRDLFIETLEFVMLYIISLFIFNGSVLFSWRLILTLLVMVVITNISTHVKMNRFVNTVIAVDISKTKKQEAK
ncbi:hypothetical protein AAC978_01450 [Desulfitobacterium sp. THU1]|uniref:hypothetical protein n=1 Tax=Desulfitobacterium sp. THU1 TaxID=3138072 RepID=UPI00311EB35E